MNYHPIIKYKELKIDDYSSDEGGNLWTQVCKGCASRHKEVIDNSRLDDFGSGICGILGCRNEDTLYFDIDYNLVNGVNIWFKLERQLSSIVAKIERTNIFMDIVDVKKEITHSNNRNVTTLNYEIKFFLHSEKSDKEIEDLVRPIRNLEKRGSNLFKVSCEPNSNIFFTYIGSLSSSPVCFHQDQEKVTSEIIKSLRSLYESYK